MSDAAPLRLHLTRPARRDIAEIDLYTLRTFGEAAADRYDRLIRQALRDIQEDPNRPGARVRPETAEGDVLFYHLSSSRTRVDGQPVKEPRHFLVYRRRPGLIEILRVLHDSRDLARHVPRRG